MKTQSVRTGMTFVVLAAAVLALSLSGYPNLSGAAQRSEPAAEGTSVGNPGKGIIGLTANEFARITFFNPTNAPVQVAFSWQAFPSGDPLKSETVTVMPGKGAGLDFGNGTGEVCPAGTRCEIMGFIMARGNSRGAGQSSLQLIQTSSGVTLDFDPSETLIR